MHNASGKVNNILLNRTLSMIRMSCFASLLFIFICQGAVASDIRDSVYRMGHEDVILLKIFAGGKIQFESELLVSELGTINAPLVGNIKASGLTAFQLENNITVSLAKDFFVNPQVHIKIKEFHSLKFFISGAVKRPGMYELNFIPSVMDLIAKAEGVTSERGDTAYILKNMTESDQSQAAIDAGLTNDFQKVDLIKLLDQGDLSENLILESNDTIYIPSDQKLNQMRSKIYVEGEVSKPGVYAYQPGVTALSACIMAGGFAKYAAPGRTKIIRSNDEIQTVIKINLNKVKTGKIQDIFLEPGDLVHVPESWL